MFEEVNSIALIVAVISSLYKLGVEFTFTVQPLLISTFFNYKFVSKIIIYDIINAKKVKLNMSSKDNRFIVLSKEGSSLTESGQKQILIDKETGVNYLLVKSGYGLGITPLLDKDGKPVISKIN